MIFKCCKCGAILEKPKKKKVVVMYGKHQKDRWEIKCPKCNYTNILVEDPKGQNKK